MAAGRGIDITGLDTEEALRLLGQGDWLIVLTAGLPDVTISQTWRQSLQTFAAKQFVEWVIAGIDRKLSHDNDPPWDCSGQVKRMNADSLLLLARYTMLVDWAKNELTGHSRATFVSGMGLWWETYHDDIESVVETQMYDLLEAHCRNHFDLEDDAAVWEHKLWDHVEYVMIYLESVLVDDAMQMTTSDAWQIYESEVRAELEARHRQAEKHAEEQKQARIFWRTHFPDLVDVRIELPQFREMNLEDRISECFADADPHLMRLITAGTFLPGNYSNGVREWIRQIAQKSLTDD